MTRLRQGSEILVRHTIGAAMAFWIRNRLDQSPVTAFIAGYLGVPMALDA